MKKSVSSKTTRLTAHASPFHSGRLFEADDASITRRSKRVRERFERNPRLGRYDHRSNVPVVVKFGQVKAEAHSADDGKHMTR
jgi:hypothetical protein